MDQVCLHLYVALEVLDNLLIQIVSHTRFPFEMGFLSCSFFGYVYQVIFV